jgi:DNA-binding HxlR family transcriptional regulator
MPSKNVKPVIESEGGSFSFRVKIGDYEVEIKGTREEVTKTIENLPEMVTNVHKAFEIVKPKTVATITVKTEPTGKQTQESPSQSYPKITSPASSKEAVVRILETDWGKWRPRTTEELKEALKANDLKYSGRVLSETLDELADKGLLRRWNTTSGFVYILAEKKSLRVGKES